MFLLFIGFPLRGVLYGLSDTDGIEEISFHVFGCMLIRFFLRMGLEVRKLLNIYFLFCSMVGAHCVWHFFPVYITVMSFHPIVIPFP